MNPDSQEVPPQDGASEEGPSRKTPRVDARHEKKKGFLESGHALLECKQDTSQHNAAEILLDMYKHIAYKIPVTTISGGETVQTALDLAPDTIEGAVLARATSWLLKRAEQFTHPFFKRPDGNIPELRANNCSFVMTTNDALGQLPHADALDKRFLTCVVYLTSGTRGTEVWAWPHDKFKGVSKAESFTEHSGTIRQLYGEAVTMGIAALLAAMVPVKEMVAFGDMLIFSPARLHRGPPSIDERLCFFCSIEEIDAPLYDPHSQFTIDFLSMRILGLNSKFMQHHDALFKRGFHTNYTAQVETILDNAHKKWLLMSEDQRQADPVIFTAAEKKTMTIAFTSVFDV